jgi:hypothetical protein
MRPTVNGVLIPDELLDAPHAEQETYAASVKAGNARFCATYFALDDAARRLGFPGIDALAGDE